MSALNIVVKAVAETAKIVKGMSLPKKTPESIVCPGCQMEKGHQSPFPPSKEKKTTRPFELVHADLFGPGTPPSFKFYEHIVQDDFSGYFFVTTIAFKDQAFAKIRSLLGIAKHFNHQFKSLQTDDDTIYKGLSAKDFYQKEGITHLRSVPYVHQQNGQAERAVRTVSEAATALLQQARWDSSSREIDAQL